jgi:DNA repair protein RadC
LKIAERKYEVFGCVFVDNRHRIIAFEELFRGTIDGASVHPRVIVQKALENNAAAVLLVHNHPLCGFRSVNPAHLSPPPPTEVAEKTPYLRATRL